MAFEHLDTIEDARTDLAATLRILSLLIGSSRERDAGVGVTIERHFATDLAKLEAACSATWEAILTPLHAVAHPPETPPTGTAGTLADGAWSGGLIAAVDAARRKT